MNGDVFKFELYNLNYFQEPGCELSGHYTFWYSVSKDDFVFCKHGDYANLVSIQPVSENPRIPTQNEYEWLQELLFETIAEAYFYDSDVSCNRGDYLLPYLKGKAAKWKNGKLSEHFKNKHDEFFTRRTKCNCIFDLFLPEDVNAQDKQAILLLQGLPDGVKLTKDDLMRTLEVVPFQFEY